MKDEYKKFEKDIEKVININCIENHSNTPDFLLSEYLTKTLNLIGELITSRDNWYSIAPFPGWKGVEKIISYNNAIVELENRQNNIKKIPCETFNENDYIIGLYNGYEIALSILKNIEPKIKVFKNIEGNDIFHTGTNKQKINGVD